MAPCVTLHLTVISAEGLKDINYITKMRTYVEVSIVGGRQAPEQRTLTDMEGGTSPTWNCPMKFTFDGEAVHQDCLTLVMMIRTRSLIGHRDVVRVCYPMKQLMIMSYVPNSPAPAVGLATSRGGLKFSYRFEVETGTAPKSYNQSSYPFSWYKLRQLAANTTVVVGEIALFFVQAVGS